MSDPVQEIPVPPKTVMILGPFLDNVIEPVPSTIVTGPPAVDGRRQILFDTPPTTPGGNVHLKIQPPLAPTDVLPLTVYAFFVADPTTVPAIADRTTDWFFKSGAVSASIHIEAALPDGSLLLTVNGVTPSLTPYFVQVIFEFPIS
jgi:hypothetical protein